MEHHRNLFQSLIIGFGWSFASYKTQLMTSVGTIVLGLVSTILIFFCNRFLKKHWPDKK